MDPSPPSDPLKSNKTESSPSDQNSSYIPRRCLMLGPTRTRRPDPTVPYWLQKLKNKKADDSIQLPDKYNLLCDFFFYLVFSLKLLRLNGKMPSLKNISPMIESVTNRKFSIARLAQLKYILPNAIVLRKVLVHDEKNSCMKPDIHVTLNVGDVKNGWKQKIFSRVHPHIWSVFRSRLLNFVKTHPEEDVPEEPLPKPFYRLQINLGISSTASVSSTLLNNTLTEAIVQGPATSASHSSLISSDPHASFHFPRIPETPIKIVNHVKNKVEKTSGINNIPGKVTSTPEKLMSVTPALAPPKRCYMSPDDDSSISSNILVRRTACRKSLKFDTPVKSVDVNNEVEISIEDLSSDDDIYEILPKSLIQSIREKELKIRKENYISTSQARRRKQMITNLPKLFDMIHHFFQMSRHSLISKEELLHRLVSPHIDIIDKEEAEEQLVLLKELVPDLVYEKLAASGDLLIGINKLHSPQLIHAILVDAK